MFFDTLNNTLFNKNKDIKSLRDTSEDFSMFMMNRWASMYDGNMCNFINMTTNKLHSVFDDKLSQYRLSINCIPRLKRKHIRYIKKVKQEQQDVDDNIDVLAQELELSKREINIYINEHKHRPTSTI